MGFHLVSKATWEDKFIARAMVKRLPFKQRKAITLRFWHNKSIYEIAKALRMTWGEADNLLKEALLQLKENCLKQPRISRAFKQTNLNNGRI